jgi:hypothetical protein
MRRMRQSSRSRGPLVAALVVAVALSAVALAACGNEGGDTTSRTTRPATTTVAPSTTPSTTPSTSPSTPVESTTTAVWPWSSSATRYSDPVAAARGFAVELVGFADPVVGEFRQGDARSGEVDVRAKATTTPTTVLVRQINGSWWVLGATTTDIQVSAPAAGATISSPVTLQGTSTAFEATVNTRLFADGTPTALATGFVMGGSMGTMGPFADALTFPAPPATAGGGGALVFLTLSPEDGRVLLATVLRVHFA